MKEFSVNLDALSRKSSRVVDRKVVDELISVPKGPMISLCSIIKTLVYAKN